MQAERETSHNRNAIIIFVRNPVLGQVKTRLAASFGEEKALTIYKELLQHTFDITVSANADKYIFYADSISENDLWDAAGYFKRIQSEGNLGDRMKRSLSEILDSGCKKVMIIGSDCIELTSSIIEEAFKELDANDVVIGPANDGGYYLLAMKKIYPFLFENKQWSTDSVYGETLEGIRKHNLLFHSLKFLTDVDTEEDWLKSKKNIL